MKYLALFCLLVVLALSGCALNPPSDIALSTQLSYEAKMERLDELIKVEGLDYVINQQHMTLDYCSNALSCAVKSRNLKLMKYLLELGADPNRIDEYEDYPYGKYPPIHPPLQQILRTSRIYPKYGTPEIKREYEKVSREMVDLLIKYGGAKTNVCTFKYETPLNMAIDKRRVSLVAHLLKIGAYGGGQ